MNIVRIEGYACGYYSDSEWSEHVYLTENGYNKIKDVVDNLDVYIYDLDGKHSETEADIIVEIVNKDELGSYKWRNQSDGGDTLFYSITNKLESLELDFDIEADIANVNETLSKIDSVIDCEVQIKSSQFEALKTLVEGNFNGCISLK